MPAKYHPVAPTVWNRTFRRLSLEAKATAFYIWSCPTRCSEGLFRVPVAYIVNDTGISEDEVMKALEELRLADLIQYDEESETVLDRIALKHNPILNGVSKETGEITINKRLPGALKQLELLTDSPLLQTFAELASRLSPDFGLAIYEKFPYLNPPGEPLTSPFQVPTKGRVEKSREEQLREEKEKEVSEPESCQHDHPQTGPPPEEIQDPVGLVAEALGAKVVWQDGGPR